MMKRDSSQFLKLMNANASNVYSGKSIKTPVLTKSAFKRHPPRNGAPEVRSSLKSPGKQSKNYMRTVSFNE